MDAQCKQLCACIGFSIRLARKGFKQDVLPHLWTALRETTTPSTGRPISLYTALGFVSEPTDELPGYHNQAVQTDCEVILRPDLERIMENTMAGVRKHTEVIEAFQLRIAELEHALENNLIASTCSETRSEDHSATPTSHQVLLCASASSISSPGIVVEPDMVQLPPVFPASVQDQMEAHKRERQALKIQRRRDRKQALLDRELRLNAEGG